MKKIVGILAASAVLASSVFAADVAAKVKLTGNVFKYDGASSSAKTFDLERTDKDEILTVAIDDETVGAKVNFKIRDAQGSKCTAWTENTTYLQVNDTQIWFKPLDMLKVIIGNGAAPGLSNSYMDGHTVMADDNLVWRKNDNLQFKNGDAAGYGVELNVAGILFAGYVGGGYTDCTGGAPFSGTTADTTKDARVKVGYAADGIGAIAVIAAASDNFTENFIGAEYKNDAIIDGLGILVQGGVDLGAPVKASTADSTELTAVDFLASAKYTLDALTVKGDVFGSVFMFKDAADTLNSVLFVSVFATAEYSLGNITPYFTVKAENLAEIAKNATGENCRKFTVKPGCKGTFGLLNWDAAAELVIQDSKFSAAMPVEFSVAF